MKKIKLKTKNRALLAPMEQVNDVAFRILCKKAGAGATFTGMINPLTTQKISLDDKPILQLFCKSTKGLKEFIKKHNRQVLAWDFNLGCPSKNAKKHGFGVFLHHDLKTIEDILKEIKRNTKKPIGVKLRKSKYTFKILEIAEKYCDFITIHPRTQKQGYGGIPDLKFAKKIKSKTKLPVVYSGDVNEKNYKELLKKFDYVMIARKAIGNPNIFSVTAELKNKTNFNFLDWVKLSEKYNFPFRQLKFQAMCFTKNMYNASKIREEITKLKSKKEIIKLVLPA